MKKYWIIENGKPIGPFSASELTVRRDFTASLPVWCSELPDWTTVGQLPELASLLPQDQQPQQQQQQQPFEQQQQNAQQQGFANYGFGGAWFNRQQAQRQAAMQANAAETVSQPKTYVGWSILMVFFCLPLGIVALLLGSMVRRRWNNGDVDGAIKASNGIAWCLIIGIVATLVSFPFQIIYTMLQ